MFLAIILFVFWIIDCNALVTWIRFFFRSRINTLFCYFQCSKVLFQIIVLAVYVFPIQCIAVLAASYFCLASSYFEVYLLVFAIHQTGNASVCCQRSSIIDFFISCCCYCHRCRIDLDRSVNFLNRQLTCNVFPVLVHNNKFIRCCLNGSIFYICCCCIGFLRLNFISLWQTLYCNGCSMRFSVISKFAADSCYYDFILCLCDYQLSKLFFYNLIITLLSCSFFPVKLIGIIAASYFCLASGRLVSNLFIIFQTFDFHLRFCQRFTIVYFRCSLSNNGQRCFSNPVYSCNCSIIIANSGNLNCDCLNIYKVICIITYFIISSFCQLLAFCVLDSR